MAIRSERRNCDLCQSCAAPGCPSPKLDQLDYISSGLGSVRIDPGTIMRTIDRVQSSANTTAKTVEGGKMDGRAHPIITPCGWNIGVAVTLRSASALQHLVCNAKRTLRCGPGHG